MAVRPIGHPPYFLSRPRRFGKSLLLVYTPFDVLLLFQERQFRPWWFETATPTVLVDVLTERHTDLPRLGDWPAPLGYSSGPSRWPGWTPWTLAGPVQATKLIAGSISGMTRSRTDLPCQPPTTASRRPHDPPESERPSP
jgi:hypothetical protein